MGYVNIETAHILRALHESRTPTIVTPGRFGSDVVGAHPLEEKISTDDAYRKRPEFAASVLQSTRELEPLTQLDMERGKPYRAGHVEKKNQQGIVGGA
ncbi:hypothetical protein ABNQ24_19165 (plasmid) [Ralstonia pseudosolanacearum]|uniref:hypothetical protein n=1 Tax=Ralstonia pseudosolanacearum TaxID=1310165 RepID=UPI00336A21CB